MRRWLAGAIAGAIAALILEVAVECAEVLWPDVMNSRRDKLVAWWNSHIRHEEV